MKTSKAKPKPAPANGRDDSGRFRRGQAPKPKPTPTLVVERVNLHTLHEDPSNPNTHPEEDIVGLMAKLATFRQVEPLVVQKSTRKVIGGNGRLEAMRRLGWVQCDVHFVDVDNVTATALGISLNRRKSLFDESILVEQLRAIQSENADLMDAVGYNQTELDALIAGLKADITPAEDPGAQVDRAEELLAKWKVKAGQLWVVPSKATAGGEHRVLCGDSTKAEDVARVMGGEKAEITLTDPPYNVGVDYGDSTDDEQTDEQYSEWTRQWFMVAEKVSTRQVITPGNINLSRWTRLFSVANIGAWNKGEAGTAHSKVTQFIGWEPILFYGESWPRKRHTDVFSYPGQSPQYGHPCPKPLKFWCDLLDSMSQSGAFVLDPFLGAGTTVVAAEQTGRLARGIEIAPKYVAVTLERLSGLGLRPSLQTGSRSG